MLFDIRKYSSIPEWDEYEIYHDENKANRIIHGYLLIPLRIKDKLLREIDKIRKKHNCDSRLHYTDLSGKTENIKHKTVRDIIGLMSDALRIKNFDKSIWGYCPPRCKFVLFMKKNIAKMDSRYFTRNSNETKLEIDIRKIETLMRIGLKGGLHYLFDEDNKIEITGFYTDGMAWCRSFDKRRVCQRLHEQKRDYIKFASGIDINPVFNNHKDEKCKDYDRAQLLQVCDCVLGAFINCIFGGRAESYKTKIAIPIKSIMEKHKERKGNFKYSGHYKSYVVTKSFIENGKWSYRPLKLFELKSKTGRRQLSFF